MGSGKSTIAPILANTLGYSFLDVDHEIEKATGKKVSDIFTDHGEEYFRSVERELLENASAKDHCVVSLGGGTIANDYNFALIKRSGILVYLRADVEQIVQRMKYKTDRPLLTDADGRRLEEDELRKRIIAILRAREGYYTKADLVVETGSNRVGVTVDELVRLLAPFIGS